MCLAGLPTTSDDGRLCPGLTSLEGMSEGGLEIFVSRVLQMLRPPSSLSSISAMAGLTSIRCSVCEVEIDLQCSPSWASSGFELMGTPALNGLIAAWPWLPTPPST